MHNLYTHLYSVLITCVWPRIEELGAKIEGLYVIVAWAENNSDFGILTYFSRDL